MTGLPPAEEGLEAEVPRYNEIYEKLVESDGEDLRAALDDLLATGGTARAGIQLVERLGGEIIGCAFIVDLPDLGGRAKLEAMGMEVHALCAFEGL